MCIRDRCQLLHIPYEKQLVQKRKELNRLLAGIHTVDHPVIGMENPCLLYTSRTEFLFMNRETAPDEEEQYRIYSRVAGSMGGRPLTIRTLDIGGDKNAPCVKIPEEENPFLGYRAIRLCLDRREELLLPQLRAILRAGVNKNVRIMLPMITSLEEFRAGKADVYKRQGQLRGAAGGCEERLCQGAAGLQPGQGGLREKFRAVCGRGYFPGGDGKREERHGQRGPGRERIYGCLLYTSRCV